jgi:hypothetical protein
MEFVIYELYPVVFKLQVIIKILIIYFIFLNIRFNYAQTPDKVEVGVCPFEGCKFGEWICKDTVNVYEKEGDFSSVKYRLHKNDTINAITGNIHYEKFGKVVITKPIYKFLPNDTLIALRCCSEINFYLYRNDTLYCTEIFWPILTYEDDLEDEYSKKAYQKELQDTSYSGIMIKRPQMVWWIQIIHNGNEGWIALRNLTPYCCYFKEIFSGMDRYYD